MPVNKHPDGKCGASKSSHVNIILVMWPTF